MIGGIVFVIIVSVVTALMINNTADGVINDYKTRFGSEVSFSPNMQRMNEAARESGLGIMTRPSIAPEDLIKFGQSDYLKETIYTAQTKAICEQLKPIDEDKGGEGAGMMSSASGDSTSQGRQYFHKLFGDYYADFKNGLRELTEGSRYPANANECIISQELLENSELSIGDVITVNSALEDVTGGPGNTVYTDISWEFTIVGTYYDLTDEYGNGMRENAFTNRRNEIITTFEAISEQMIAGLNGISVEAKFYLKNPGLLEAFTDEVHAKGLSSIYDVNTDSASYDAVVGPVEGLKGISITFVIIVLAFGSIILALLASIAIRERKYEIGVLRAMGMDKIKVVAGLWTETLTITVICLVIGLGVGMMVAQPVTNVMLDQQVAAAEKTNTNTGIPQGAVLSGGGTGSGARTDAEPLKNLNVSLNFLTFVEIIGIALLLTSLSGVIATQKITKYEPIKILMERA
jgi:putative ABC transport system permease protein